MSLYDRAYQLYGARTAKRMNTFFNDMQLPMPSEHEFTETEDKGFLVFLNEPGVVIRFTNKWKDVWNESRRVLHPLGSRITGRLRADINPGILCPLTDRQREELQDGLKEERLMLSDAGHYNGGTLPAVEGIIKAGHVVAVDPFAVIDLSSRVSKVGKILSRVFSKPAMPAEDDPQTKLYGRLRDIFTAAWKKDDHPDPGLIRAFWQECREMKEEKRLLTSWLTAEMANRNYKNAYWGSINYMQHMRTHEPQT
jgi:hypothetical protein